MPAQRGPEETSGKPPHEKNEPTRRLDRRGLAGGGTPRIGLSLGSALDSTLAGPRVAGPARPAGTSLRAEPRTEEAHRDERTQLAGAVGLGRAAGGPVVGWLVVMDGPGRGQALALGYGINAIGRGADQRVSLDFGDQQISRANHATVVYDPRGRQFFLQHGDSTNLTYLDGQLVLTPQPLAGGSDILIGRTRLRFVALCGPTFDWQDE